MRRMWVFVLGAVCGAGAAMVPRVTTHLHAALHGLWRGPATAGSARAHTEEKIVFTAHAPMEQVAPLFGADKERAWSPKWDPQFVHPLPAMDAQGMVFTVAHDHLNSIWVNTDFDLKNGLVQYVFVIPDALVTVIKLKLTPEGDQTQVEVEYDRTALSPNADAHVRQMAEHDRSSGTEWERSLNGYLKKRNE